MTKAERLKGYIESRNGGYRINGAYANGIGSGGLLYDGEKWLFIPTGNYSMFTASDECVLETLDRMYITIVTNRNSACEYNPYIITKEKLKEWENQLKK
jgi:hypothetical protein